MNSQQNSARPELVEARPELVEACPEPVEGPALSLSKGLP